MNELALALALAGLAFGATIAIRAAMGLFTLLARGLLILVILAMAVVPFVV